MIDVVEAVDVVVLVIAVVALDDDYDGDVDDTYVVDLVPAAASAVVEEDQEARRTPVMLNQYTKQ